MSALNIGRNQDDASFRYKMPRMSSKIEGRGNGIKTVILNMSEVARALNVDADYPTKFFGTELGSQSRYDAKEDRAVVNGAHDPLKLAELLNKFIELFILCPNCNLPEIIWQVDVKREQIKIDCAACGNHSLLKHGHKLITYILKNPPAAKGAKSLKSPSSKKEKKNKKSKGGDSDEEEEEEDESQDGAGHQAHIAGQSIMDANAAALKAAAAARVEDDIEEWGEDTSKEARAQRRADEMKAMAADAPKVDDAVEKMLALALSTKEKDSPVYVLRRFILQAPHSVTQIMAELRRLELARNLTPSQKMRACIEALLDTQQPKAVLSQLKQHEAVIKKLAADKLQLSTLFGAFEEVLGLVDGGALMPRTSHILQALYESDIFDEDFMLCWFESPPESSLTVPRPVAVELRKKAEPFIEWLKTADDDDDDESDDE